MKVFVQIPCYNEEATLPLVLESIPKKIPGINSINILVIDDASTDKTIEVARKHGVQHFVLHARHVGLARQFHDGVNYALSHGADIVINTDGDNQYPQERIVDLVQPIVNGTADIVIADRQTDKIAHFSPFKKLMQRFGSWIVNKVAGTNLPDAASGFRAYSRESLYSLNVITKFSYTMETIVQAGNKNLAIASISVTTNPKTRESRLFKNVWQHMFQSGIAIVRAYIMFKPYVLFATLGITLLIGGLIPFVRYGILVLQSNNGDHLQSLIFGVPLLVGAFLSFALGIIADLIRTNRVLIEDLLERTKWNQYK